MEGGGWRMEIGEWRLEAREETEQEVGGGGGEGGQEGVHARFLRVVDGERGDGAQEGGGQAGALAKEAATQQVGEGDERHSRHDGERAQRKLVLAEQRPPPVEQQVIAGRVNVACCPLQDEIERTLGDTGRVALVVPEGLRVEAVEAEKGGKKQDGKKQAAGSRKQEAGSVSSHRLCRTRCRTRVEPAAASRAASTHSHQAVLDCTVRLSTVTAPETAVSVTS